MASIKRTILVCITVVAGARSLGAAEPLTFEHDIRPLFREHCFDCHGASDEKKGGLDLRLRRWIVQGGESGAAIVPDEPDQSLLLQRVRDGEMPPGDKKVPLDQLALLTAWVAQGAPTARPEPDELDEGIGITPEERAFWSFQPIRRPSLPGVSDAGGARTAIDLFVIERLQTSGLSLSADADRATLMRRAYLDLLGLPPTFAAVEAFVHDARPDAYDRLLDRLLASPLYGQRWGRHWLDVAGYADSEGYTNADADRPWAYKYRDYVVNAFNRDAPFDQFIRQQLAGDEMVSPPYSNLTSEQIENLVATGFLRMAADGTGSGDDSEEARQRTVTDTLKIVSTSLLGMSLACAQCHDHRYDPLPQADYYQFRAIFDPALDCQHWRTPQSRLISLYTDQDRAAAAAVETEAQTKLAEKNTKQAQYIADALEQELAKHPQPLRDELREAYRVPEDKRSAAQQELLKKYPSTNITAGNLYQYNQARADELKALDQQIAQIRSRKPREEFIRALTETPGTVPVTHVFYRGDFRQPTQAVSPADLTIASAPGQRFTIADDDPRLPTTGRRLAYASWLTNGRHPLVARVIVNRVWMHHFARGLVSTPADFGKLGQPPTHPELLDWLADEFMASGWDLKRLHKLIMTSSVYRQASRDQQQGLQVDGSNQLLWKYPVRRLDAEIVRDRILWTSGRLITDAFDSAVALKVDDAGQVDVEGDVACRSLYVAVKRTQPLTLLQAFDAPVMETNCEYRPASTAATQSLMLMNGQFVLQQARYFAQRVLRESAVSDEGRDVVPAICRTWQLAYGRQPSDVELTEARAFVETQRRYLSQAGGGDDSLLQPMTNLCQTLLSSNEFLYVD